MQITFFIPGGKQIRHLRQNKGKHQLYYIQEAQFYVQHFNEVK